MTSERAISCGEYAGPKRTLGQGAICWPAAWSWRAAGRRKADLAARRQLPLFAEEIPDQRRADGHEEDSIDDPCYLTMGSIPRGEGKNCDDCNEKHDPADNPYPMIDPLHSA